MCGETVLYCALRGNGGEVLLERQLSASNQNASVDVSEGGRGMV